MKILIEQADPALSVPREIVHCISLEVGSTLLSACDPSVLGHH